MSKQMKNDEIQPSKINLIEKIRWRISYKELFERYGYDISKIKRMLSNKEFAKRYKSNKEKINQLLDLYEKILDSDGSNAFDVVMEDNKNISCEDLITKINEILQKYSSIQPSEDEKEPKSNISRQSQKLYGDYLSNLLKNITLEDLRNDKYREQFKKYEKRILLCRKLEEMYGDKAEGILREFDKIKNDLNLVQWFKSYEGLEENLENALMNGTSISTIKKFNENKSSLFITNKEGPNVRKEVLSNIEEIEFYLLALRYDGKLNIPLENKTINSIIKDGKIPIEQILNIRGKHMDALIQDEQLKGNLKNVRDYACLKYFGLTSKELPKQVQNLPEESKKAIQFMKRIYRCNTFKEVETIMSELDSEGYKFSNVVVNQVSRALKEEFNSEIFSIKDRQPDGFANDGTPYYILKGEPFKMIIHATQDEEQDFDSSQRHLCTSVESDRAMKFFRASGMYLLGYSNFTENDLLSNPIGMGTGGQESIMRTNDEYLKTLTFSKDGELETFRKDKINEVDIKPREPDYCLIIKNLKGDPTSLGYGRTGLPTVYVDAQKYLERSKRLANEKLTYMKENFEQATYDDFLDLKGYSNMAKFYGFSDYPITNEVLFYVLFKDVSIIEKNPKLFKDLFKEVKLEKFKEQVKIDSTKMPQVDEWIRNINKIESELEIKER